MTAKDIIEAVSKITHTSQNELSRKAGKPVQWLNTRMTRGTLRVDDLLQILDVAGIDITLTVRETGEIIKPYIVGYGRRVRRMVDRVIYDTAAADALSNSFFTDGVNEFNDDGKASELYMDRSGRYFLAEYTSWEGEKDRIEPVSGERAAAYIAKHGTTLMKKHNDENAPL